MRSLGGVAKLFELKLVGCLLGLLLTCLSSPELSVEALLVEQLLMGTSLGNLSLFEQDDLVRIDDGAQPMRNHQHSLMLKRGTNRRPHLPLGVTIELAGGLVQNKYVWISQQRHGQRQTLNLSTAQTMPSLTDHGIKAIRQGA